MPFKPVAKFPFEPTLSFLMELVKYTKLYDSLMSYSFLHFDKKTKAKLKET